MKTAVFSILLIATIFFVVGCAMVKKPNRSSKDHQGEIIVGGLYATPDENGMYRVTKVLVVDQSIVHLRSYKNKFNVIPYDINSSKLSLGSINDPEGFGIGHFPMAKEGFWISNPIFLKQEPVSEEELEGYRMYLEAMRQ